MLGRNRLFVLVIIIMGVVTGVMAVSAGDLNAHLERGACYEMTVTIENSGTFADNTFYDGVFVEPDTTQFRMDQLPNGTTYTDIFYIDDDGAWVGGEMTVNGMFSNAALAFGNGFTYALGNATLRKLEGEERLTRCLGAILDGRINQFDTAAGAVLYHSGDGGFVVYAVDFATSDGRFDYAITINDILAGIDAARQAGEPQPIAQGVSGSIWVSGDGICSLFSTYQDGKQYRFDFGCP